MLTSISFQIWLKTCRKLTATIGIWINRPLSICAVAWAGSCSSLDMIRCRRCSHQHPPATLQPPLHVRKRAESTGPTLLLHTCPSKCTRNINCQDQYLLLRLIQIFVTSTINSLCRVVLLYLQRALSIWCQVTWSRGGMILHRHSNIRRLRRKLSTILIGTPYVSRLIPTDLSAWYFMPRQEKDHLSQSLVWSFMRSPDALHNDTTSIDRWTVLKEANTNFKLGLLWALIAKNSPSIPFYLKCTLSFSKPYPHSNMATLCLARFEYLPCHSRNGFSAV